MTCIISEELLINPNDVVTRSGIERATMGIWDKETFPFANPNELHTEEAMEGILEVNGFTALYLDQETQASLKKTMGNFDDADLQKAYAHAKGKDDETVTIASRSRQIGRNLQIQTKIAPPPGFSIAPSKYP